MNRKTFTDKQMLDWLSKQVDVSIRAHYNSFVEERSEKEKETGGYNGNIDFFTCHSQHLDNCKDLRTAISKAMKMRKIAD